MISVVMTTYNGEKYLGEQIASVLLNLSEEDELIISDDGSKDRTKEILRDYREKDSRIRLYQGPQKGINANFEFALKKAKGDIIFICDQDDIWEKNKKEAVLKAFSEKKCMALVHDCRVIDDNEEEIIPSFMEYRASGSGALKNIVKNSYIGCCMAFRKELLELIFPIPRHIEMYDQWIGVLADVYGASFFLKERLIRYRRHGENASSMQHYPLPKMIRNRVIFVGALLKRICSRRQRESGKERR